MKNRVEVICSVYKYSNIIHYIIICLTVQMNSAVNEFFGVFVMSARVPRDDNCWTSVLCIGHKLVFGWLPMLGQWFINGIKLIWLDWNGKLLNYENNPKVLHLVIFWLFYFFLMGFDTVWKLCLFFYFACFVVEITAEL